jgi:hypothetical protein
VRRAGLGARLLVVWSGASRASAGTPSSARESASDRSPGAAPTTSLGTRVSSARSVAARGDPGGPRRSAWPSRSALGELMTQAVLLPFRRCTSEAGARRPVTGACSWVWTDNSLAGARDACVAHEGGARREASPRRRTTGASPGRALSGCHTALPFATTGEASGVAAPLVARGARGSYGERCRRASASWSRERMSSFW